MKHLLGLKVAIFHFTWKLDEDLKKARDNQDIEMGQDHLAVKVSSTLDITDGADGAESDRFFEIAFDV